MTPQEKIKLLAVLMAFKSNLLNAINDFDIMPLGALTKDKQIILEVIDRNLTSIEKQLKRL